MNALRAYPTLLRVGFSAALAYRAELVIWMLTTTMPLVSLSIWTAVAREAPVGRYGPGEFVGYFLAALVVRQVTGSWLVWEMNQEIRQGTLSQRLLKPIHPLWIYSAENLAALPLRAALCLPVVVVAVVYADLTRSGPLLAIFFASLLGAWLINFFTMAIIGSLAFFLESSTSVFELWLITFMLLSGYVVPLELFPGWVRGVAEALPFRYTLGFPVEVVIGLMDTKSALRGLAVQYTYAAAAAATAILVFRAGVRRFGAFGG
ncbi:ABC transporter permease [Polyangium jinanense]|uniref:ABC-2 family transporter protein n=1 Tax=Polyangium jinanense TaxID=2829994 RepID=A0A9X3X1R6_9BACT|nr:ABC-2 family transporter protein [Polyangium jinanense]MDC3955010.1 ABC-2 family transporter protein [Polyangium jinanense]MDC3981220.1 ABC-2 family transporter protein [Polyangium jinanense]